MFQTVRVLLFSLVGEFSCWLKQLKCSPSFKEIFEESGGSNQNRTWFDLDDVIWFYLCLLKFVLWEVKRSVCLYRTLMNFDILKLWQTRFHLSITFAQCSSLVWVLRIRSRTMKREISSSWEGSVSELTVFDIIIISSCTAVAKEWIFCIVNCEVFVIGVQQLFFLISTLLTS